MTVYIVITYRYIPYRCIIQQYIYIAYIGQHDECARCV